MRDATIAAAFPPARFCRIRDIDDLTFSVKESEIVAGQQGRVFYLGHARQRMACTESPNQCSMENELRCSSGGVRIDTVDREIGVDYQWRHHQLARKRAQSEKHTRDQLFQYRRSSHHGLSTRPEKGRSLAATASALLRWLMLTLRRARRLIAHPVLFAKTHSSFRSSA